MWVDEKERISKFRGNISDNYQRAKWKIDFKCNISLEEVYEKMKLICLTIHDNDLLDICWKICLKLLTIAQKFKNKKFYHYDKITKWLNRFTIRIQFFLILQ